MLLDRLCDVPRATHAGGERREVALTDRHRPSSVARGDCDLPLEQITRFGGSVGPRKLGRGTPPRAPAEDAARRRVMADDENG